MDELRVDRAARESELVGARGDREERATELRTREHELAVAAGAPHVSRRARRGRARSTATGPGRSSPSRLTTSGRWDRWLTTSRSTGVTSEPSKRVLANRCSTSSSPRTSTPPLACGWRASGMPGASASSSPIGSVPESSPVAIDVPAGPDATHRRDWHFRPCGARDSGRPCPRLGRS